MPTQRHPPLNSGEERLVIRSDEPEAPGTRWSQMSRHLDLYALFTLSKDLSVNLVSAGGSYPRTTARLVVSTPHRLLVDRFNIATAVETR